MRLRPVVWLVALAVLAVDQVVKWWAIRSLHDGHTMHVLGDWFGFKLIYNEGAALSLLGHRTWMVTTVMVAVLVLLVWLHPRANGALGVFIFGIAIGGALGNITDRFYQGVGWGSGPVIDMIKYGNLFIGNVADAAIVLAAALTIIAAWAGKRILKPRAGRIAPVAVDPGGVAAR